MEHFYEIQILPDPEFKTTLLMNALYNKLHRALVQLGSTNIGISFPKYDPEKKWLGGIIRFHANLQHLEQLQEIDWLKGMRDHVQVSSIQQIPAKVQYVIFKRIQAKTNVERIRRRQMKRHNLTHEEVIKRIPEMTNNHLDLPFLNLKSQSTSQAFKIFIKKEEASFAISGNFNAYGLSKEATVPLF